MQRRNRDREREKQMVSREFASGEVLSGCSIMKKCRTPPGQPVTDAQTLL